MFRSCSILDAETICTTPTQVSEIKSGSLGILLYFNCQWLQLCVAFFKPEQSRNVVVRLERHTDIA